MAFTNIKLYTYEVTAQAVIQGNYGLIAMALISVILHSLKWALPPWTCNAGGFPPVISEAPFQ